jgi:hypothetical protein
MQLTFALGVPHTPWRPERAESMRRMFAAIGGRADYTRIFSAKCRNWEWSEDLWRWGLEMSPTHVVELQDDVIPSPRFWPSLRAMVSARPTLPIGLHSVHPRAAQLASYGARGYTTADGLVGVGYVIPTPLLRVFLEWRKSCLKPGAVEAITEDTLLSVWMLATGVRCWHPLPTIIDHDTSLESTYGNDGHSNRRAPVRWDTGGAQWVPEELEDVEWWRRGPGTPHLGRYYIATPHLCRQWVIGWNDDRHRKAVENVWRGVIAT